jgi:hypothetical protein
VSGSPVSVYFLFVAGITMVLDAIRSRGATHPHAHDGTLTLARRTEGGLHATVELPAAPNATTTSDVLSLAARRPDDQGET